MTTYKTLRSVMTVRTIEDIEALERLNYDELVTARNIHQVFEATARLHGERPALTVLTSAEEQAAAVTLSHQQLYEAITRAANLFTGLGAGRDSVIAILSRTHPDMPVALWAAQTAAVASCLNYLLATDVIIALANAERAEYLICPSPELDEELWQKALAVAGAVDSIKKIVVLGTVPAGLDPDRFVSFTDGCQAQPSDRLVADQAAGPHDRAALFHTGGTTGVPKLVPQTHLNQIHGAWTLAQLLDLSEQDCALNGFPLFHVGGTSTIGLSVLAAGGHVVMLTPSGFRNKAVVANIWRLVERFRATYLAGVPTAIGSMSEVPTAGSDLSSLRFVLTGGASLTRAIAERFVSRTGLKLVEQYGMTETVASIAGTPVNGEVIRGSVGLRAPFSTLRILRESSSGDWQPCASNEPGMVAIRGPQVVSGYLDPAHTRDNFTEDGFLLTGDVGYLDDRQYLHLTGREKDLIIRSGHNIDPAAIEEAANAHPEVLLSAAVGMPDAYSGEVPVLYVSVSDRSRFDEAAFRTFLENRIHEPPARPRFIYLVDEIPVTAVGKLFKPTLRHHAVEMKVRMEAEALTGEGDAVGIRPDPSRDGRYCLSFKDSVTEEAKQTLTQALSGLPIDLGLR